jgi:hypothetical protein
MSTKPLKPVNASESAAELAKFYTVDIDEQGVSVLL